MYINRDVCVVVCSVRALTVGTLVRTTDQPCSVIKKCNEKCMHAGHWHAEHSLFRDACVPHWVLHLSNLVFQGN
jgi:hypothetical protein